MREYRTLTVFGLSLLGALFAISVSVPRAGVVAIDPGPRPPSPDIGSPLPGLSQANLNLFLAGQESIQEIDSVQGTLPDTGLGLGPLFNMDSCGGCHNYPAPGGSSPPVNPQVAVATKAGATNTVPFFVVSSGPILHPFIKNNPDGSLGERIHVYTITGRVDAPGCSLTQPDFDALNAAGSLSFHIPLQLYGLGLVQTIADSTLSNNLASQSDEKQALGIGGHLGPMASGNIGRFTFKAQSSSLLRDSAGAYAGEVGVTNAIVRNENDQTPGCQFNQTPEDRGNPNARTAAGRLPDFAKIAEFATFLAPPTPAPATASSTAGQALFAQIGCALCHTPSLQTAKSSNPALSNKTANLYSDLALHKMGPGLADGIILNDAGGDEFRSTPLWGVGMRLFLLHDGRTTDMLQAILAHASPGNATYPASEANQVINAFNALSVEEQQNILDFLRSL